ncbi:twin-arginine translocase subunit TatB [Sphingomonas koreensis]|nr:twin-arginine translocase subunit TatB [Sphingomonas koreensis]
MFDIGSPELLLVAVVAIVVIGPKDLPKAMRVVGYWVGKAHGTMRQFRSGFDAMVREAELAEMEKRWKEENARIMREHPGQDGEDAAPAPRIIGEPAASAEDAAIADQTPPPVMVEKPAISSDAARVMVEKPAIAAEPELPLDTTPDKGPAA